MDYVVTRWFKTGLVDIVPDMTDPLSLMLLIVIVACVPPLVLLVPRDPLVRRWQARRYVRQFRKGVR